MTMALILDKSRAKLHRVLQSDGCLFPGDKVDTAAGTGKHFMWVEFFLWIKNMPKVFHGLQILRGELLVHEWNLFDFDAMFP